MKKKFYLYLGFLGVGLILGSFISLISTVVGDSYASGIVAKCDDSSVCSDGWFCNEEKICEKISSCDQYEDNSLKKLCSQCDGTWNFSVKTCVNNSFDDEEDDNNNSGGGFYFINSSGECEEYPSLPGYCIESGTKYYSSASYSTCNKSLSCKEVAVGYYGNSGGSSFYAAQGVLNNRTYYTDSGCKNIISSSSINSQASEWCNGLPSFDGKTVTLKVGETITLKDSNGNLSDFDVSSSSSAISVSTNGNNLTLTANKATSGTTINMSKGTAKSYQAYCSSSSQDYVVISNLPYVSANLKVYTTNEEVDQTYGGFKIIKTNAEKEKLSGVKFKIGTNLNGSEGVDWNYKVTDANGEILVENIPSGTNYYYQEIETLDGYILDDKVHNLSIKENEILEVTVVNQHLQKSLLKIFKTDIGGKVLPGVKFKVGTNLNGIEGIDWDYMTTNASGYIILENIDLNTKIYYQEVETLNGYTLDDEIYDVIIDRLDVVFEKTVINYNTTSVTIIKKDADNGKIIRNAEFNIYDSNDKIVYTKKTDADGKIIIRDIPNGKYYAKESKAPDGYLLNKEKYSFEISDSNKNIELVITNKPDNPSTGVYGIWTTLILGVACLGISIFQYKKLKNVEIM